MTKEEWKKVEETLKEFFSSAYLKVDGYNIVLRLVRTSIYKNAIMVYVNGQFEYKWLAEECEERRRFCQKKGHSLLSPKQKADFKKLSKKVQKELSEKYHHLQYEVYSPCWTSFGALKKHLIANNKNIELIKIG